MRSPIAVLSEKVSQDSRVPMKVVDDCFAFLNSSFYKEDTTNGAPFTTGDAFDAFAFGLNLGKNVRLNAPKCLLLPLDKAGAELPALFANLSSVGIIPGYDVHVFQRSFLHNPCYNGEVRTNNKTVGPSKLIKGLFIIQLACIDDS